MQCNNIMEIRTKQERMSNFHEKADVSAVCLGYGLLLGSGVCVHPYDTVVFFRSVAWIPAVYDSVGGADRYRDRDKDEAAKAG